MASHERDSSDSDPGEVRSDTRDVVADVADPETDPKKTIVEIVAETTIRRFMRAVALKIEPHGISRGEVRTALR